jgi:uncharacterized protein YndB with AHSA1/START domain
MAANSSTFTLTTPSEREIVITRMFDAPRELVFKAVTDPTLIPRWWGPRRYETIVDKMDVRVGGVWRFINRDADGNEFAFNGTYREIVPPERVVQTFEFEPMPGHVSVDTMTLEEVGGKTKLTSRSLFDSREDRDGMMQSDMESGVRETYDRFEEVLQEIQKNQRAA